MAEPIVLGIVGIKNMGDYDAETNYEKLNVVTYQGSSYCALKNTVGNSPTNTEYWQLYAQKGDVGPQGPKPIKGVDYYTSEDKEEIEEDLADDIQENVQSEVIRQVGNISSGTPLLASTLSDMTDTTRLYVLITDGYVYYYNGATWVQGWRYQTTGIGDNTVEKESLSTQIKEEYDNVNLIHYSVPDSLKIEKNYNPKYYNENINSTGVKVLNTPNRLRTNFLPLGLGIVFTRPSGSIYGAWCRGFDKDYNYVASYVFTDNTVEESTSFSQSSIAIDRLIGINKNIKFVILVFVVANDFSQNISSIDWVPTIKNIDFKKLDSIFEYRTNNSLPIEMEYGSIRTATGIDNPNYFETSVRSKFYYETHNHQITKSISGSYVLEYDEDFNYIKSSHTTSKTVTLDDNTRYLRFEILSGDLTEPLYVEGIGKKIKRNYTINENTVDCQRLYFPVKGESYYSSCLFKLPINYNPVGDPIPMIVFIHGSGDYLNKDSLAMTTHYNDLYNYFRDNGYAVWDCHGWGSYIQSDSCSTYGTPYNNNVYSSGIEYFTDLFNIDKNNIYVVCKSLGGIQALSMLYQDRINIKAIGFFAPALSSLHHGFGYNQTERNAIAHWLNMTTPPQSPLTYPANSEYVTYFNNNLDKLLITDPYWKGLMVDRNTKLSNSINYKDNQPNQYENNFKSCKNIPLKFWFADDDINVPINAIKNIIQTIENYGGYVEYTKFPNGTGGHHCVDSDENAPKTLNVTTKLGIHYDSIPTAYYEFIEFISRY